MFFNFVDELRAAGIPASFKEHLVLPDALDKDVIERSPEAFYYLARATFVKDEGLIDRFDQVFQKVFRGIFTEYGDEEFAIPEDWLRAVAEKYLSPEDMALSLSPLRSNLWRCFLSSSGLGSKVSIWEGPPSIIRKIQRLALAA